MEYFTLRDVDWESFYDIAQHNVLILAIGIFLFLLGYLIDEVRGASITILFGVISYLVYLTDLLSYLQYLKDLLPF